MQVGSVVTGLVTKIVPFGAFVDIDGVTGLVHVSQISEDYVEHPEEVLSVGDEVTALVRRVEPHTGRVALSIRALERAQKAMQRNTKLKALRGKEDDRLPDHVQVGLHSGVCNIPVCKQGSGLRGLEE
jgi:ribosomal protein S1